MEEEKLAKVPTKRIEYIDAMRGFTMMLVVLVHVCEARKGLDFYGVTNSINRFFSTFRMPLFFFVSGFVFFKASRVFDFGTVKSFLAKKFTVQIVPTVIFGLLFAWFSKYAAPSDLLFSKFRGGYWFTVALFEFFLIYIAFTVVADFFKLSDRWRNLLLVLIALLLYPLGVDKIGRSLGLSDNLRGLLGCYSFTFFIFFVFGTLARKYYASFTRFLTGSTCMAVVIALYFAVSFFAIKTGAVTQFGPWTDSLYRIVMGALGITVAVAFFHKYQASFSQGTRLGRTLQYIGRRTLDIYLLHYFFLPYGFSSVGKALNGQPVAAWVVGWGFTVVVVAFCLVLSSVIRVSPLLARLLFGVEQKK